MGSVQTEEWQRRLNNAKECAEQGKEGDTFFLQVSSTPLVSLFITTGSELDPVTNKRKVDLRFVGQPSTYPTPIDDEYNLERVGYERFIGAATTNLSKEVKDKFVSLSMTDYRRLFKSTVANIDASIQKYHGIKCFRDGDITNRKVNNIFFLHICDIFNIMVAKEADYIPTIKIRSALFQNISNNNICNEFEEEFLESPNRDFLLYHIDFFYMIYCYYSNHSFMAIRMNVYKHSTIFKQSSFFTNERHFIDHQYGKLKEFNQNNKHLQSRVMYRSI